jgi:hypothetical protein
MFRHNGVRYSPSGRIEIAQCLSKDTRPSRASWR